ncbi:MAG: DUF481 domain-containing protein [Sphingopyxis sp.]|uniref:DUF481 domain-containing protein n=1 Tax=Sphingopyxis sp. TaxID=1908224 RepID=UPI002ABC84D9|nr:DUF481 domain-containing protein [Sphingopyxis sp.]MDZ3830525.1 DUF481 domain-containing protein [Sphingopyxis sp.]
MTKFARLSALSLLIVPFGAPLFAQAPVVVPPISPLLVPPAVPVLLSEMAPRPLPVPVRTMIEAALEGGKKSEVETVVSLAKATNPRSIGDIDAILAAHQARRNGDLQADPDPVRDMLAAAIESKKDGDVEAVGKLAKRAAPDKAAEVDALLDDYRQKRAEEKRAAAAAERERLAQAKIWQNWKGEGQIGASHATGNTRSAGISLGIALARKGIDWNQRFRAQADYQRTNGRTTIEKYLAEYEPQIKVGERAFAYGFGRWERDRMQGYSARWNLSGGMGYKLFDAKDLTLSVKAGPAWRRTEFLRRPYENELTGLAGVDFGWQVSPTVRLTQVASAIIGERTMTTSSLTALNAKLTGALSARVSYSADYDTSPPAGVDNLDTLTRFTLVYGF